MDARAETPMHDHVNRAVDLLKRGAHMNLDLDWATSSFPGDVSHALAARIIEPKPTFMSVHIIFHSAQFISE
ncbi:MAG: hypothetical protein EOP84_31040 [Verrucomicrobiaceae bacterium]|nr:MAG: hypothetical protein EOP84_31040 [Verrucomicrobiaceae bacterium]